MILEYLRLKKISLSKAVSKFRKNYPVSGEINIKIKDFDKLRAKIKQYFKGEAFAEIDGLSVTAKSGEWFFNIRPSHTEPLVRLNIEAKNIRRLARLKKELLKLIN